MSEKISNFQPNNDFETWSENLHSIIINHQEKTGLDYLNSVLLDLSRIIQAEHVFVGVPTDQSCKRVITIAYCANYEIAPNFEYELEYTPCEGVVGRTVCSFTSDLAVSFPKDQFIIDLNLKSYLGVPLFDLAGNTLGIVAVCFCREVEDVKLAKLLITLIGNKLSSETHMLQSQTSIDDSKLQFQQLFDNSADALLIQDLSRVNKALQKYEHPISELLDNNDDLLVDLISKVSTIEVNESCFSLFQCKTKDQLNQTITKVLNEDFKEFYKALFIDAFSDQYKNHSALTLRNLASKSQSIESHWVIPQLYQETWEKVFISITDITSKSELEQQLRHSEKMRAIGQLAGGIAHDFNNMLAGIVGAADLLMLNRNKLDAQSQKFLEIILNASERATGLTSNLLAFARKSNVKEDSADLHSILQETINIVQRTFSSQITIKATLNANNFVLCGDQSKLQSAVLNILINSSQAIESIGEITIATSNTNLDQFYCDDSIFDVSPGPYIELSITDTGCGIPTESLHKIFEPFYTTKEVGRGTGLGLAAVFGTIQDHRGSIYVYSKENVGTKISIFLPCDIKGVISRPEEKLLRVSQGETILLADDEEVLRITTQQTLQSMGYKVLTARDGLEAVEVFKKHQAEVSLVILDLNMPIMNGPKAFQKIMEISSNTKVIISSGMIEEKLLNSLKAEGLCDVIHKPFRIHELSQTLANHLEDAPN